MMDADPFGHKRCSRCEDAGTKPARERALDAALEADGRVNEAETREYLCEMVDVVLAAVGHPAHQSSDEGTCWCPTAEQAGRERDHYRQALLDIADHSGMNPSAELAAAMARRASAALDGEGS